MNPLQQYIDLYLGHQARVNAASAPALNARRGEALRALQKTVLPRKDAENYEHIDLPEILGRDWGVNLFRTPMHLDAADTFSCQVPNLSTSLYFLSGDGFAGAANAGAHLPPGVIVCSLHKAATEYPHLIGKYYGKAADMGNPLVALNTLLAQDGLFVYLPQGTGLDRPLQLVSMTGGDHPMMAVRRILVVAEQGASGALLCCDHTQRTDRDYLNLLTTEVFLAPGADFQLYEIEESTARTVRLATQWVQLRADAQMLADGITLYNGITRNEYYADLCEPGAAMQLLGMGIEDDSRILDTYSKINHLVPHCTSDELFKYVVDDGATGSFAGRVYVAHGAEKTQAMQANRNLVASPRARMFSKPQLEIYADDVKCSHGTAIGQLDPMQIFYMRTRGLDESRAKTLLRQAFMADIIDAVRMERLRDRLRHLVDMRLDPATACHTDQTACNTCNRQTPTSRQ